MPDSAHDDPRRSVSASEPTEAQAGTWHLLRSMPVWPLLATLAVQTLATMAMFSVPTVAPEIALDLNVSGALVGYFVALAYGIGIVSALFAPGLVRKYGGVRATQAVLAAAAGMLVLAAVGRGVAGIGLAAFVLGLGYGAAAPASTHLLVPQTPRPVFNLVMSFRQIGVPLGGVLAALILPPIVVAAGWRWALAAELVPILLLIIAMEFPRKRWDYDREPDRRVLGKGLIQPFTLLAEPRFQRLSIAAFVYSGISLSVIAFTTVQLTTVVGLNLVEAGQMLAAYQLASSITRPIWGWVADRYITPAQTLAMLGLGMAATSLVTGMYGPHWPIWVLMINALVAGTTSGGYTGVAYAEYAALGGVRRTEAAGLGTAIMFFGGMAVPAVFGMSVAAWGGYGTSYTIGAACALVSALLLLLPNRR
ncbi:MAG TPA: MFS transporter [Rhodopila sp.]|uniref:MFS transporter n=1 Tax=Rhodopila sp. TaxID=2480087 RepID=UPI002BE58F72|nr:MFS transporter [Rhodopila sp.]HVY14288.1 MFS transporter [Rhodopila sp.]